jgi:hypothetical protein
MKDKETVKKLRILLPHWIDHNHNHETEFRKWADAVRAEGLGEVAALLDQAIAGMAETDAVLQKILDTLGGPAETAHHHHHD